MNKPPDSSRETRKTQQTSVVASFRYRFVTHRNLAILAAIIVVALSVMFVPW